MAKPYQRAGSRDEDVSPLQWTDGDASSPDTEGPDTEGPATPHGYRSGAPEPAPLPPPPRVGAAAGGLGGVGGLGGLGGGGSQVGSEGNEDEDDDDEEDDDDDDDDDEDDDCDGGGGGCGVGGGGGRGGADDVGDEDGGPKRRGPKRKRMTKGRQERFRARRVKANARERSRMHGLNDALEGLRSIMPCHSKTQKLSKIETLRLARNYICALSEALEGGQSLESRAFLETLCKGLSQPTSNLVAGCLQLGPGGGAGGEQNQDRGGGVGVGGAPGGPRGPSSAMGVGLGYSGSPGLPSPPYGSLDSAHLQHMRALKGAGAEHHQQQQQQQQQQQHNDYGAGGLGTPPYDGPPTPPLSIGSNLVAKQESSPHYGPPQHYSPALLEHGGPRGGAGGLYPTAGYEVHLDATYDPYHPAHMTPTQMIYRH